MSNSKRKLNCLMVLIMALMGFVVAHAQSPDPKTKATASISGRVTVGDKPAPGIVVGVGKNQATTDADGRYRIEGLSEGQLSIVPFAPAYFLQVNQVLGPGRSVQVNTGEAVDGIDFKLTKGAVITGRIMGSDGRPVIEQRISLLALDESGKPMRQQPFSFINFQIYQTDDRGVYRIYGLAAGHYKVSVGDEAGTMAGLFASGYYQRTYYPDATDPAKATIVDLGEGGEAKNIDIKLGDRSPGYTVSGRIVDADTGQPLSGISYGFGVVQKNQNFIAGTASPGTTTNSRGEFRLEGVLTGKYAVFIMQDRNNYFADSNTPNFFSDPVMVEVMDGDVSNLELKAQKGVTLSGVVVPDGVADKQALLRLMNFRVSAMSSPLLGAVRLPMGTLRYSALSPDGSFQIDGLIPGNVSLSLSGTNGYESMRGWRISRIERDGVVQPQGLQIRPGQNLTGIRVFVSYGTGTIRGQLKVEGGTLPGSQMIIATARREGPYDGNGSLLDSRGQFVIKDLRAGTYVVEIHLNGTSAPSPEIQQQLRQTVTVTEDGEAQVLFTINLGQKVGP